jgi:hypothetical protein
MGAGATGGDNALPRALRMSAWPSPRHRLSGGMSRRVPVPANLSMAGRDVSLLISHLLTAIRRRP